ncbi:MAG: glycosyltransferase family 4 protein [bacterium]|nr:glycosyltransferase family 4 protein [bacterium]
MNTRTKILFCITKSVWGGAQKYVFELATHLPSDQFEIIVAAGGSGPLFGFLNEKQVRTISIPRLERDVNVIKEIRAFFHLIKIIIKERPDIIHLNSSKMGAIGAVAAHAVRLLTLNHKPHVVFTVHGWGFREDRNYIQRVIIFAISWISTRFHHSVILINSADYADARVFIPHRKLSLIPLGIAPISFSPREHARAFFADTCKKQITDSTVLIGTTAELTKNKGLTYLMDSLRHLLASSQLPDVHCVIMGEGEERSHLEQQIARYDLGNRITLAGFVTDAKQYLPGLDIFILSSVKEGLPYALMEAMSAGLPVIASRVGGIPDLISHQTNGLLNVPKNHHTLTLYIQELIAMPEKRKQLGIRAKETIITSYSLENMVVQTSHLYHELT